MNEQKDLFTTDRDEHKARTLAAIAGFVGSRKRGKVAKTPCRTIDRHSPSFQARVDAQGKRLGAGKGQEDPLRGIKEVYLHDSTIGMRARVFFQKY